MTTLVRSLLTTGLIQFGQFQRDGGTQPFLSRLDMLASYPETLQQLSDASAQIASLNSVDRLLCAPWSLPLGMALALRANLPLIYSRGLGESTVDDLVGAYDIGHPALLVANLSEPGVAHLLYQARRVGLDIQHVLVIVETTPLAVDVPCHALVTMHEIIEERDFVPPGQRAAVQKWLQAQTPA
jgi:hypothetical protein